jgi:hypothetical protein
LEDVSDTKRREAEVIHRAVFRRAPSDAVVERFALVSQRLDALASNDEVRTYYAAIARVGDVEALEVAARYRGRLPLLTKKVRAMVYLAETVPENQGFFVGTSLGRAAAYAAIFWGGIRTAYKMIKGVALLSRVPRA